MSNLNIIYEALRLPVELRCESKDEYDRFKERYVVPGINGGIKISVVVPEHITEIREKAFCHCLNLSGITFEGSVTKIGDSAFWGCLRLNSIIIPDSVTEIGEYSFSGCSLLESITIPDRVTKIGDSAFCGCSSLTSIIIPDSVTEIGQNAFNTNFLGEYEYDRSPLLKLVIIPDNPKFRAESCLPRSVNRSVKCIKKSEYYSCVGGESEFNNLSEAEKQIVNNIIALSLDDNLPENSPNKFRPDARSHLTEFIDGIINGDDPHAREFMFQLFKDNIDLAPDCYKHQVIDEMSTSFTYKFKGEDNSILEVASLQDGVLDIYVNSFTEPYDFITEVKNQLVEEFGHNSTFIKLFDLEEQDKKDFLVGFLSKFQNQSRFFRGSSNKQIIFDGITYSDLPTGVASALNDTLRTDIRTIALSELKQTLADNIQSYVNNENTFSRNLSFFSSRSDETKDLYDNSLEVINSI